MTGKLLSPSDKRKKRQIVRCSEIVGPWQNHVGRTKKKTILVNHSPRHGDTSMLPDKKYIQ